MAGVNVLLDTNVLSEPMREWPDAEVMAELEQGGHSLQTASLVVHELSYRIQGLAACLCRWTDCRDSCNTGAGDT